VQYTVQTIEQMFKRLDYRSLLGNKDRKRQTLKQSCNKCSTDE